jgi:hypothetical protein
LGAILQSKIRSALISMVSKSIAASACTLRGKLSEEPEEFIKLLTEMAEEPEVAFDIDVRVEHAKHGKGLIRDRITNDHGKEVWVVFFENGDRHHYTLDTDKLVIVPPDSDLASESSAALRTFKQAVIKHRAPDLIPESVIEACYLLLKKVWFATATYALVTTPVTTVPCSAD